MADPKIISAHRHRVGETPMWDDRKKVFWWSDMMAGELYRYTPDTGEIELVATGPHVSGMVMNEKGGLVCATHEGIYLFDEQNGFTRIAEEVEGQALHCNDATADAAGRFIFGTTFYAPGTYPLGRLYSMEHDRSIRILDEGYHLSNGIGFTPDDTVMYVTDSPERVIYAFDYDIETGNVSNKRDFINIPKTEGIPDGMTVDANGDIWSAMWYGSCIMHYDDKGNIIEKIVTGEPQTSSLVFGGKDLTDVLVTSSGEWAKHACAPIRYDYDALTSAVGGKVMMYNFGVKGRPESFANIQ